MNKFFRYGLPPGSALILVAMMEVCDLVMTTFVDWFGVYATKDLGEDSNEWEECIWLALMVLQFFTTAILLLYGVILKGRKSWLIYWIGSYVAYLVILILSILIELFIVEWSILDTRQVLSLFYIIVLVVVIFSYDINLCIQCLPHFDTIVDLEPIGKGWAFIVDFFKTHAKEAASLMLMFEIVWNIQLFLDRQTTRFVFGAEFIGYEGDTNLAIITEETILRYIRIVLACIGFYIAYKEKKYWMFHFCVCYLITIAISGGIFVYLLFIWRAEHDILTLMYFCIFLVNLVYRGFLMFVCVKYTDVFERRGIPM